MNLIILIILGRDKDFGLISSFCLLDIFRYVNDPLPFLLRKLWPCFLHMGFASATFSPFLC